jgi:tRNA G18 (ribose-2'-O)-methylase SpoU
MSRITLVLHNIRSTHNVGAFLRTCDGFGVKKIIFSGYTPYPTLEDDTRLPHFADKITRQIHKTALGAETMVPFEYQEHPDLGALAREGYEIVALEQAPTSINLRNYHAPHKLALLLGEEVHGIPNELLKQCPTILEIPMVGTKESFNVSVAAGIALYQLSI